MSDRGNFCAFCFALSALCALWLIYWRLGEVLDLLRSKP